jgi:hypothetical protein
MRGQYYAGSIVLDRDGMCRLECGFKLGNQ